MPNLCCTTIFAERVTLKPVSSVYEAELFRELTEEVARYLVFQPTGDIDDTRDFISQSREEMGNGTALKMVILDRITGSFLGYVNLRLIDTREPKIGIWIAKSEQGKGYGKQAVQALMEWADGNLVYDFLRYPVASENIPSQRLAESLGGVIAGVGTFRNTNDEELEEIEYRISSGRSGESRP